jgi:hypothetical protein
MSKHERPRFRLPSALALIALCLGLMYAETAHAQYPKEPPPARIWFEDAPRISVLTFGPGDAAFLRFGHNAIRVRYPGKLPLDLVYNFGTFRFDNPLLIIDFLTGKFQYWLSVSTFQTTLRGYKKANRDVIEQELLISNPKAWELAKALRINALPENRAYLYDYYRDNCSTRVRDAINEAISGALKQRTQVGTSYTLRDHTLRLVANDFWLYVGLDIAMGPYIDQPETRWSEMFLPEKVKSGLANIVFSGPHGTHKLVKETTVHYRATGRTLTLKKPPNRTLSFLQGGSVVGGLMAFFAWEATQRRQRWARLSLSLMLGAFGALTGVLGLLFCGLWGLTNHEVTYYNENILQCAPWGLALTVSAWGIFKARLRWLKRAEWITAAGLASSLLGLLLKAVPAMEQHNERIIALFLPLWIGAFFAVRMLRIRQARLLAIESGQRERAEGDEEQEEPESERGKRPTDEEEDDEEDEDEAGAPSIPAPA